MTTILSDLDGTIMDSFLGITRCVKDALKEKRIEGVETIAIERY